MLKDIFSNSSDTRKRKAAADLLVQCYILVANLAVHLEGNSAALRYVKIASGYVEVASNRALAIRIARTEGNAHDYAGRKQQALQAGLQAKYLLETNKGTPFHPHVTSKCYSALANYQAQNGQKQDALASLRKAHTAFFASSDEPVPIWAEQSMGNLLIHDGLTHYYLGLHKKAVDSFEQISTLQDSSETNRIEALIDQVWAGVMRDGSRDLEKCIALWKQGIQGAISIQSQAQYEDGMAAYTAMRAAWPGEKRIRDLQDYAVHW